MFNFVAAVFLVLAVVSGFMYVNQPNMIFFPIKELRDAPGNWGMEFENVHLQSSGGVDLHGWYIPGQPDAKTLLFFHGNAGNISHRGDSIKIFHNIGLNVFIFDYRGYGSSSGKPGEQGLYDDGRSAWRYLTETRRIKNRDIVLFGRSLGGAVATRLAAEVKAGGLILESTFSSARDMAANLFPVLSHVIYLRFNFNTLGAVRNVHCPILVIHGPDDEIIPYSLGEKVFQAANQPKQFIKLKGDHNSGFLQSQPQYQQSLNEFIATLNQPTGT